MTGRTFEIGGGAVALVDTPRPGAGFRSGDTPWTVERLAEAIPAVLGAGQQPYDPREAMTHLAQLPIHAG